MAQLKVTQIKSKIGGTSVQRNTLRGQGRPSGNPWHGQRRDPPRHV
jgi:hypothetical protein